MALGRATFGLLGLLFGGGGIVMMIITLLGGTTSRHPEDIIFFLEATTDNIPGAPPVSRWTFWNLCLVGSDGKNQCGPNHVDFPFDPPSHRNFNTTVNVPHEFVGSRHYFLTSRFMFPFMIISLFFLVIGWFIGWLSLCTKIGGWATALMMWVGLMFQTIVTCLMTAVFVQGRNNFNRNRQSASLGSIAFGLMWASLPCLFLASMFFGAAALIHRRGEGYSGREQRRRGFFKSRPPTSIHETTDHTAETRSRA